MSAHQHDDHDHEHEHEHEHDHGDSKNPLIEWFQHTFTPHDHGHQTAALDAALATDRGIWAVKVSLVALLITAIFQIFIVAISGSVALLADTIHNFSDALTAIPLGLAFTLSRRARNSRFTYGYGRAEDIAGVIIVLMILFSAIEAIYQSIFKLLNPQPITNIGWVAVAAVISRVRLAPSPDRSPYDHGHARYRPGGAEADHRPSPRPVAHAAQLGRLAAALRVEGLHRARPGLAGTG